MSVWPTPAAQSCHARAENADGSKMQALRGASSQSFAVRIEREANVPLVVHGLNRRGTEQPDLRVGERTTARRLASGRDT